MSDRIDELSERARWYLQNFDEIDLADICASQEATAARTAATIARVQNLRDDLREITGARYIADALDTILGAPTPDPAAGPTVTECAANDRRWPLEKHGE